MFQILKTVQRVLGCGLVLSLLGPLDSAHAAGGFSVLHTFTGAPDGADPAANVIMDRKGNLYGTTRGGGLANLGTLFKLMPDGKEKILHNFGESETDGATPTGGLIRDKAGNLYGVTFYGGGRGCGSLGCGTVYEVAPDGTETVLYAFAGGSDGSEPQGNLIADKAGDLYGTTFYGGETACGGATCGTVFKIANGVETVFYAFKGGSDGYWPDAGLIADSAGNLYGTTQSGGSGNCFDGCGTIYRLSTDGRHTVLYAFAGGNDGANPTDSLIIDNGGNLYGTTFVGGANNVGTAFKLAADGTETVLHTFGENGACYSPGTDGCYPLAELIMDAAGNLYGTTEAGGPVPKGMGTIFEVATDGSETVLHTFKGAGDTDPAAGLLADSAGNLYGTTRGPVQHGRVYDGTVFKLKTMR